MSILESIKEFTNESLGKMLRNVENRIVHLADVVTEKAVHKVKKQIISILLITMSFLFFSLAAAFFLIEYLDLTKTLSFLFLGFIILIVALILKISY